MVDLIFVYGSLLRGIDNPKSQRLAAEADWLGPATMAGRLYRLSWYPIAKPSDDFNDVLVGDIYRLRTPAKTLIWLDAYEGITQDPTSAASTDKFFRTERVATLSDGRRDSKPMDVFVYFFRPDRPETDRIFSGSWLEETRRAKI